MSQALQALSLLVNSGITLKEGLAIVSNSSEHFLIKSQISILHDDVASGQLLGNAIATASIFLPEIVALIHIGEETGTLGQSLESAAAVYHEKLDEQLGRFVFFSSTNSYYFIRAFGNNPYFCGIFAYYAVISSVIKYVGYKKEPVLCRFFFCKDDYLL
jgi:hypothetical protein